MNKERKDIETLVLEEALAIADRQMTDDPSRAIVVVASEAWHKGVVGLVASRLVERFRRPACVIAWEGTDGPREGTGSLRSIAGVDLGARDPRPPWPKDCCSKAAATPWRQG